jgi:cytochrome oxidase Cu insertion factor (SCO1/SenC/PrrC family)
MNSPSSPEPPGDRPPIKPWTIWMLVAVIALGGVVGTQLLFKRIVPEAAKSEQRPPYLARLEQDLEATEASGKTVRLGELQGKVYVISYVYTTCPRGCAGVVAQMKKLQEKFAGEPRFRLVSVSVNPAHDTPAALTAFAEAHELNRDRWWLLTGDQERLRRFMTRQVKFSPVKEIPPERRVSEFDVLEHDLRVALIDGLGHVRGYYDVMHPDPGINGLFMEKLEKDIATILAEGQEKR